MKKKIENAKVKADQKKLYRAPQTPLGKRLIVALKKLRP